jgi:prepilin-type N-terminal cleavage/methylation domain-containing protein
MDQHKGAQRLRRRDGQAGYSVIELLVAITIFALVLAAASLGLGRALSLDRSNRRRSTAAYLASQQLEEVRAKAFDQVAVGTTTCVYSAPGPDCNLPSPYTVTRQVSWTAPGSTSTACNVPSGSGSGLAYKRVTVTVTWTDMRGVAPVSSQTLHILVRLFDRDAAPLVGHTVTLSGPASATQQSTDEGCAFFAYLDPGTYTVTLNTTTPTPGYVDRQGNQPAVQTVAVTASQISTLQFDYDRAATLQVGLTTPASAVIPAGIAMTVANSNLTVGTRSFPESSTGSGATRTVTPLFPYTSGYEVWAGDCADADPATYPGGSRGPALASNPGGTSSGSRALDAVDVVVRRTSVTGALEANATVSGIHAAGTGCTAGETLTSATTTNASGQLRLALPSGTWRIRATTSTRTGTSSSFVLDPVSSTIPIVTVVVT